ncbi:Hypothetical predicted protein [Olea europaea subsp. europaea]|uniref:Enhancer of polycomb-like protein n=1 Tax=Olea europaea subsp. europaea TaxID=158383 RepID=A0A8S0QW55_OLEEU|nr:Hypothetical predicted protein [Olea europaea subsp. europaea]
MENSKENSSRVKIPGKSRSLDLQSLYKSGVSKEGPSKKRISEENQCEDVNKNKKKRKSRKEVPLSHFDPQAKKNRKDEVISELELKRKSNSGSNGLNGISFALGEEDSNFKIPRRPRGSVGRKKFESIQDTKQLGLSDSVNQVEKFNAEISKDEDDGGPDDEIVKVVDISKAKVANSKVKRRVGPDEVKESRTKVARRVKEEDCLGGVNNGNTSSEKPWNNIRKRKHLDTGSAGSGTASKKTEPLLGSLVSSNHAIDFQNDNDDDDEENLEQNAARMLSSRFDPSCTGFSSRSKSDVSRCANGFSYLVSSARDMFSQETSSSAGLESASAHTDIRNLRPRKEHKGKRISRKRRHFYEIDSGYLDAHWVLNRRIKVFWPLDETWYYGRVSEYDSESKLHHINYDDKDEEWINLRNEKFKLLLLPSEVPCNAKHKKPSKVDKIVHKGKAGMAADDDSSVGTYLDSEPIISWLARSSRRVKPSPSTLKKQKTMQPHLPVVSQPWSEESDNKNKDVDSSESDRSQLNSDSALPDVSDVAKRAAKSRVVKSSFHNRNPVVYMRKRFRNMCEGFSSASRRGKVRDSSTGKGKVTLPVPVMNSMQTTEGYKRSSGVDITKLLWSIDYDGDLRLSTSFVSSKRLRFEICLPFLPFLECLLGKGDFWLSHTVLLQHGAIVAVSPSVMMEILFVDSDLGVRFFLFEGCLKQAVALIFLILTVFNQPTEQRNVNNQLPGTSMRFRLSCIQDLKKQHLFAFYSFSKLKRSKWLCLDSKLLQHCVLLTRLLVPECTFDNIKSLEHESFPVQKPCFGLALPSFEGLKNKDVLGILPMGVSRESCKMRLSQGAFNLASKLAKIPPFAVSFTAVPAFFTTLHLKLLMDHNFACVNLQDHDILCALRTSDISCQPIADSSTHIESSLVNVQDKIAEHNNVGNFFTGAPVSLLLSGSEQDLGKDVFISNAHKSDSIGVLHKEKSDSSETTGCSKIFEKNATEFIVQSLGCESNEQMHEQCVVITPQSITSPSSNLRCDNGLSGTSVEFSSLDQVDIPFDGRGRISRQISDVGWNMTDGPVHSPNPTGPRSTWYRGRISSSTAPLEDLSPVWHDGKRNFMANRFSNGPKKPRTQVQYTLPFGGYDASTKQKTHNQRVLPCKRIRRANEKRVSDGSRSSQRNMELLACGANVLVTLGDKGWRECGAQVVLELSDHNEWRLAIKFSGITKYSFKVQHILQPGSTNRYTHAMMWKGGKDWVLEFPDRSQWMLFKEMHEECYNRNIRAASVKNIPIPGVRPIEESEHYGTLVPFVRNPLKYFQQIQTDVEMAMDSSRILYDMDSDDEMWLMTNKKSLCSNNNRCGDISDELFEKTMDMLEKVSYIQHRIHFTYDELEELMAGIESKETAKVIYEHWRQKRERIGMPLIRQLQPPLWERYEQQLKEWEHSVARANTALSAAFQENSSALEKPPMFAFCLKPRGLDVPNKGSKQRSHRRFPASGYNHTVSGDQYGLHASGRRSSGFAFGDQKGLFPVNIYDSADSSPLLQASTRVLSPRDAGAQGNFLLNTDASEWNRHTKFYNNKPKKYGSYSSYNNQYTMASYNKRTGSINGVPQRNTCLPEWSSQNPYNFNRQHRVEVEQLDGSDLHEFRLRDASGAAQHARNMAKLKREKAQRLLYRADLAIHKAVVALMTADAIKSASNSNGSG